MFNNVGIGLVRTFTVGIYGEENVSALKNFKLIVSCVMTVFLCSYILKRAMFSFARVLLKLEYTACY